MLEDLTQEYTRRDFLKWLPKTVAQTSKIVTAGILLENIINCSMIPKEDGPVVYPPARGSKPEIPETGCIFGLYSHRGFSYWREHGTMPKVLVQYDSTDPKNLPTFLPDGINPHLFNSYDIDYAAEGDVDSLRPLARAIAKNKLSCYITYNYEMNINHDNPPFYWCNKPDLFRRAARNIWSAFEEEGANEYASWILEYHADFYLKGYWPGDEFVDIIGLSVYNRDNLYKYLGYRNAETIFAGPYRYFRKNHPEKPIFISELGCSVSKSQHKWIKRAFEAIRAAPRIKGVFYWDNANPSMDDHRLSEESYRELSVILQDPYFIKGE